jgi:Ni,Fe-hydrogenase I large subunit
VNNLDKAKEKMQKGFCHYSLKDGDGKYCSVGALASALGIEAPLHYDGKTLIAEFIEYEDKAYNAVGSSEEGRTLARVIAENHYTEDNIEEWEFNEPETVTGIIYNFNDASQFPQIEQMFEKASIQLEEKA